MIIARGERRKKRRKKILENPKWGKEEHLAWVDAEMRGKLREKMFLLGV